MDWDVTIQGPSQWEHCTQTVYSSLPRQNSGPNSCQFTPLGRPMRRPRIFLQPTSESVLTITGQVRPIGSNRLGQLVETTLVPGSSGRGACRGPAWAGAAGGQSP